MSCCVSNRLLIGCAHVLAAAAAAAASQLENQRKGRVEPFWRRLGIVRPQLQQKLKRTGSAQKMGTALC